MRYENGHNQLGIKRKYDKLFPPEYNMLESKISDVCIVRTEQSFHSKRKR